MTSTIDARKQARTQGTYDIYIDIDIDCQELLDAIGLEYTTSEDDEHQNEVGLTLTPDEFEDLQHDCNFNYADEQDIASILLNAELGEYTTRVQIYKPTGDKVTFE